MPMIGIQGIRGGVGTTSLAAGLGWALSQLGERVMLVDACRDNQLCLHFNQKLYEQQGSMFAYLQQQVWYEAAFHFSEGLDFLPYGDTAADSKAAQNYVPIFFCKENFEPLLRVYDWVIFDLPSLSVNDDWVLFDELDLRMLVSVADANCHIRLSSLASSANTRYVLNQFDSSDLIQQDLSLLWRHQYADKLLPFLFHHDAAMAEALLMKQPAGFWKPDSLIAEELNTWANWCVLHLKEAVNA